MRGVANMRSARKKGRKLAMKKKGVQNKLVRVQIGDTEVALLV